MLDGGILFPFFDHMTQSQDLPFIFYFAVIIWFVFQNWVVVLWVPGNTTLRLNDTLLNIALTVFNITCWVPLDASGSVLMVRLIMLSAIFVVILAFTAGLLFSFLKTRRFVKSLLFISRIMIEVVPCLMTYPTASVAGLYLGDGLETGQILSFVLGVLAIVQLIGFLVIFYLSTTFWGATPYLPKTPFAAFDITPYSRHTMGICVIFLLSIIAPKLEGWFVYAVVASHLVLSVYLIYLYCYRPFLENWLNIVIQSFSVYGVIMDIVNIAYKLSGTTNPIMFQVLMWVFMAVAAAMAFTFDHFQEKIMRRTLSGGGDNDTVATEEDKLLDYERLDIATSERKALFYIDYGIAHYLLRYQDVAFLRYIIAHHTNAHVITHCARIVSWFPFELLGLARLSSQGLTRQDLGFSDKFILFQLQRIRLLRESSASAMSAEKLNSVRLASNEMITRMRAFWERTDCNIGYLNRLSKELAKVTTLWQESIDDFPNSMQFRDAHLTFLIEAASRYQDAVIEKSKVDLLESGVHFRADMGCYKRFISKFPLYLKHRILDVNGYRVKPGKGKGGESSNSGQSAGSSTGVTSHEELDVGAEESIGRHILTQARMRLTVERALEDRDPNAFPVSIATSVFLAGSCCIIFFYMYFAFVTYFNSRSSITERVQTQARARLYYYAAFAGWLLHWGTDKAVGTFVINEAAAMTESDVNMGLSGKFFRASDQEEHDVTSPWDEISRYFDRLSRKYYMDLMESMISLSSIGEDVTKYGSTLYSNSTTVTYCTDMEFGADPFVQFTANLQTQWSYQFAMQSMMKQQHDVTKWFTNNTAMCSVAKTSTYLGAPLAELRQSLSSMAVIAAEKGQTLLVPLRYALPLGLLVFQVIWWSLASWRYVNEVNAFAAMLLNLPKEVKRETMRPVRKDLKAEEVDAQSNSIPATAGYSLPTLFNVLVIGLFVGMAGLQMGQQFNTEAYNNKFRYLNTWSVEARSRPCQVIEASIFAWLTIISYHSSTNRAKPYIDRERVRAASKQMSAEYAAANRQLLEDDGVTPISAGVDSTVDALTLEGPCEVNPSATTYHEMYQCGSTLQLMQVHFDIIAQITLAPETFAGFVDGEPAEMVHLLDRHLLPVLVQINTEFGRLTDEFIAAFQTTHVLFFVFEIVLNLTIALVAAIYVFTLRNCYAILLKLMRRVSPVHILASEDLEAYLLGAGMSTSERIVNVSQNCIICMGSNGVIEMVNPAVSKTLGYTSEQVLSLPFTTLIAQDHAEKIAQQMSLMAEHQSSAVFEGHTVCMGEGQLEVPCSISILASFIDGQIVSYVAILKDESLLIKQQQAAEAAKQQSENLLYQILPRSIVTRINAGEKDISFSVPSATIVFIDIVKFSTYAANLTPQEIMGNLAMIFAGFDDAITNYSLLLKIKLIGDVYMAAGGLFDPERQPAAHAEQMVRFALDALRVIEDMNERLNAALAVRIGINTGGPILAGVLGSDKPTFDIIGDPINVAARLQSTDVPGAIQISEDTRVLIAELDFDIKPRGKVTLKGKGQRETFLIEPAKELGGFQAVSQPNLQANLQ